MKNMILTAVFCIAGLAVVQAQNITNNTQCDITVEGICYNHPTCTMFSACGNAVNVPAGSSTVALPTCNCSGLGLTQGYRVTWTNPTCTASVLVGTLPGCTGYPTTANLANCVNTCCSNGSGYTVQYAMGTVQLFIF